MRLKTLFELILGSFVLGYFTISFVNADFQWHTHIWEWSKSDRGTLCLVIFCVFVILVAIYCACKDRKS